VPLWYVEEQALVRHQPRRRRVQGERRAAHDRSTAKLAARDGPLSIMPTKNGPLEVTGNLEIVTGTGRTVAAHAADVLCRCGGSSNKPFCDGTHAKIGFTS